MKKVRVWKTREISLIFLIASAIFLFFPKVALAQVVINEIYYHGDSSIEWVELYNTSGEPIELNGWTISDNNAVDILSATSLTLLSNSFAVIVGTRNSGQTIATGAIKIVLGNTAIGNGLADDGDKLILKDASDNYVDQVSYEEDTTVFTLVGVSASHSLERVPVGIDTNNPSDFFDQESPTPGSGVAQIPTVTPTPTPTNTPTSTPTPTVTPTPTPTPISTSTPTPTKKPTPTLTLTPTPTPEPEEILLDTNLLPTPTVGGNPQVLGTEDENKNSKLPLIFIGLGLLLIIGSLGVLLLPKFKRYNGKNEQKITEIS